MASAFSTKNYFKKIYSPLVLTEFYKKHNITAIFEVTESTPRKTIVGLFNDFHASLSPEEKITTEEELAIVSSVSSPYAANLLTLILKEKNLSSVTTIECASEYDVVLYHYIFNRDIFDELAYFHIFYSNRGYMLYEAKEVDLISAVYACTELQKEFTRIINKDDNATECAFEQKVLDGLLFIKVNFDGGKIVTARKEKQSLVKKQEEIKIVYIPEQKEVLITFTGSKYEKLIFLDTFLRIVCKSGYDGKVESFDLTKFSETDFDFSNSNKGIPLLTWKAKAVTLTFGGSEKQKKKMKLTIPSTPQEHGLAPFRTTLEEIGILSKVKEYGVDNVSINFSFTHKEKSDKSVQVSCSLSQIKSPLCPLFPYDRYARTLLKQAGIEKGFIEVVKKEKEDVTKKWEV